MQSLAQPDMGRTVQADPAQPAGDATPGPAEGVVVDDAGEATFSGQAPALWTGFAAFVVVFVVVLVLIIRGRVYGAPKGKAKAAEPASSNFFEPAGEGADITFEDEDASPSRRDAYARDTGWADHDDSEVTIERDTDHAPEPHERGFEQGDLHDTPPHAIDVTAPAETKKKKSAFAGLFGKKPAPEPVYDPEPASEADDDPDTDEFFDLPAGAGRDVAAPDGWDAIDEAPRADPDSDVEATAREALERAAEAEALARDLKRANDEAQNVMRLNLRRQEEALEEKSAELAAMERRLTSLFNEFEARAAAAPSAPTAAVIAGAAPDSHALSEEHFEEFANLMGEQFEALRSAVNAAIERVSARIDALPQGAPGAAVPLAAAAPTAARIQLADLLGDALAPQRYALAKKLSTGRTADALIAAPQPAAPIPVDARFPVEAFDAWMRARGTRQSGETETALRRVVLRHIADAAEKLIGAEETADCAIMFVPSEQILSELHAHFSDVVQESYRARVFMTGPTSLMATLHTISGVLAGGRDHMPAHAVIEELGELRRRVTALEGRGLNGSATAAMPAPNPAPNPAPKPAPRPAPQPAPSAAQPPVAAPRPAPPYAPAPHAPSQYTNIFDTGRPKSPTPETKKEPGENAGETGQKSPFPLR